MQTGLCLCCWQTLKTGFLTWVKVQNYKNPVFLNSNLKTCSITKKYWHGQLSLDKLKINWRMENQSQNTEFRNNYTVKPVLSGHSKIDKTKILMKNGSLMKVKSIAECSHWSILQYFWPSLSDNRSWKPVFRLLFEWPLKTRFTVMKTFIHVWHSYMFLCRHEENFVAATICVDITDKNGSLDWSIWPRLFARSLIENTCSAYPDQLMKPVDDPQCFNPHDKLWKWTTRFNV